MEIFRQNLWAMLHQHPAVWGDGAESTTFLFGVLPKVNVLLT